ncbi:helix-turn-helix transcriptional regulator [Streptomyces sp. NPDC048507]|uniref:helix-turn-helix transcriptional regulator n=1 Tax=Streptomyces sp. NPDC048507 TaxID=3365560 RepID=UPI0037189F35
MFRSTSLEEAEAFFSAAYAGARIGGLAVADRGTPTEVVRRLAPGFSVDDLRVGFELSFDAEPMGAVCVIAVRQGVITVGEPGEEPQAFGPGSVFLHTAGNLPFAGTVAGARYTAAMLDRELLATTAGLTADRRADGARAAIRFTGRAAAAPEGRRIADTLRYLSSAVLPHPDRERSPLLEAAGGRLLAACVLSSLPHTTGADRPAPADGRDATSDTLRRAMAFIEDNAHRDIGLADIAASIPVTPRAVQYAFRRHGGTTPLGYLRRVRMAHAHEDLKRADAAASTVSVIAARWGFAHTGRFAAAYRDAYGVPPHRTLEDRSGAARAGTRTYAPGAAADPVRGPSLEFRAAPGAPRPAEPPVAAVIGVRPAAGR